MIRRICQLYQETNGIFGCCRMQLNLERRFGLRCNKKRIHRVMRAIGLQSVIRRKRPKYISSTPEITAENILNRNFNAEKLNEKWLTDVTEFKYGNGEKLYLSAILDLKDKSIISMLLATAITIALFLKPLTLLSNNIRTQSRCFTVTGLPIHQQNIQGKT